MPIATEDEPEDLDDDAPSRVRFHDSPQYMISDRLCSQRCALLMAFQLTYPPLKFSRLSAP